MIKMYILRLKPVGFLVALGLAAPLGMIAMMLPELSAVAQEATVEDRRMEANQLFEQGAQQYSIGSFQEALQIWQEALAIYRELGDLNREGATLSNLGVAYERLGQYQEAIRLHEQRLSLARETRSRRAESIALGNLSAAYEGLGQYQQAISLAQQHLIAAQEIDDRDGEGRALGALGNAYRELEQFPEAIDYYERSLAIFRELNNRDGESIALGNLGLVYSSLGQYQKAIDLYDQHLKIARELGDRYGESRALSNLGIAYNDLMEYQQAITFSEQALEILQEIDNQNLNFKVLITLGQAYFSLEQHQKSIEFYTQSLEIAQDTDNFEFERLALNGLGNLYLSLGRYYQALSSYEQSFSIALTLDDKEQEGIALSNLGNAYFRLEQDQQAIAFYELALILAQETNNRDQEGANLINSGNVYNKLGMYQEAINRYQQAIVIFREINDRVEEAGALGNLGLVYRRQGEHQEAINHYEQSIAIIREFGSRQTEGSILTNWGYALLELERFTEAESKLSEAMQALESLRTDDLADIERISLFDTRTNAYELLQRAAISQDKFLPALEISERGRSQAFAQQLVAQISEPNSNIDVISSSFPNVSTIQRIAQQQNSTLIEYSITRFEGNDSILYIWVIQPTGDITFRQVDLSNFSGEALFDFIQETRNSMGVRGRTGIEIVTAQSPASSSAEREQNLKQLHQLLIDPIADLLPTDPNERVVFIPHQSLFLVPFAALMNKDGTYLIEKHTILTAPSIQVLGLTHELQAAQGNSRSTLSDLSADELLIVGNPTMPNVWSPVDNTEKQLSDLPNARREAEAVAEFFSAEALTDAAATEPVVRQRMELARLIHLATHGLLEYGNPEESGVLDFPGALALAPDPSLDSADFETAALGDGLLTAAELIEMDLQGTELVVLSACDTGRGRITGDGVIGLSRSLITAGVPSVIVSLWSVPDAPTADLMTEFYRQLQQNPDKAQALRQAMLITKEQHPNPRDWAAFTLIGEAE